MNRSILGYVACIMAFMWRVRPDHPIPHVVPGLDLGLRIFVCLVFGTGVVYAILIINTLRRYGSNMDKAWKRRIEGFRRSQPEKLSQDELQTPNDQKSPCVAVVPPTPPSPRSHTTQPHAAPFSPFIPPRPASQIPPSFTRRSESPASSRNSASPPSSARASPLIVSNTLHASPEQMAQELDHQPIVATAGIQPGPAENQSSGLGLVVRTPKTANERLPGLTASDSPQVQAIVLPLPPEHQRSNMEPITDVSRPQCQTERKVCASQFVESKGARTIAQETTGSGRRQS